MDPNTSDPEDSASRHIIPRACDQCRQRKVRCHKASSSSSCSNCSASGLTCSSNPRSRESKTRVLISSQYERKIDQIDRRLDGIEQLLQRLANGGGNDLVETQTNSIRRNLPTPSASSKASGGHDMVSLDPSRSGFEGDSSLAAHTAAASEILQQAVESTSLLDSNPAMKTALSSLREIVSLQSKHSSSGGVTFKNAKALPPGGLSELPMPPMPAVVAALHRTKETGSSQPNSTFICCFRPIEEFTQLCLQVYFTAGSFSQAAFIIANAGLYYLFLECSFIARDDSTRNEYTKHAQLCQCNLETALTNLSLMLPHNYETIEALLLGASYAIEASRASLAWLLNSTAVTIGQTLGFHRSPSSSSATIDKRAVLFWCAYTLDRGLAVRLGYAPLISDDDFTISTSTLDLVDASWSELFRTWVFHAGVQGRIYHQLYCAAALALPVSQRQARVPKLAAEMREMIADALQMAARTRDPEHSSPTRPPRHTLHAVLVNANLVGFLGSLTLIYRGVGEAFADECLQSAREAMEMNMICLKMLDESSGARGIYLHWAILYMPFVPFTVIFCHVIKSPNEADMHRLRDFVHSLQSSCATSEAITKLHQLCDVLYNVASRYVEMKAQRQTAAMGDEFDVYLHSLGFIPLNGYLHDEVPGSTARGSQVGDWYSGNQYMMELLEQDVSQVNTSKQI